MKIVGFGHQSRVGKDTAAGMLEDVLDNWRVSCVRRAFALPLKKAAHALWGHLGLRQPEIYDLPQYAAERGQVLPRIGKTPVQLWVELGNAVRGIYAPTWLELALTEARADVVVISDVRFPNEAEAIQAAGGFVVRVSRPGVEAHAAGSDHYLADWDGWDAELVNDGSLAELEAKVRVLAGALGLP